MKFELTAEQEIKLKKWMEEVKPEVMKKFPGDTLQPDQPYFGAIGGGITYSFTPTGIGDIVKVEYGGEEIDLTDYDLW